mmetsp:Transcript_87885/g.210025  ORF Transcript_87885/g.210025 Transcript_87885/m.210025 type:complete len:228 (-) Transcript_87885:2300-2983(-)
MAYSQHRSNCSTDIRLSLARLSFSCSSGLISDAKTSPQSAWHAPRHRSSSGDAYLGIGASTLPKPWMVHIKAYLAPMLGFMGGFKHWRPSLVQSSTQRISMASSFAAGVHFCSMATAWSTNFRASSASFALGILMTATMMSTSLPCKLVGSATSAGPPLPPFGAAAAAPACAGRSCAKSGEAFSCSLQSCTTRAMISLRWQAPKRFSTCKLAVSSTSKLPTATFPLM